MLVIFVGMPVGGKSTALKVARELGFEVIKSGDIVREEIKSRGLPYTKETDREIAGIFHEGGEVEIVKRILARMEGDPKTDKIAIDGLRSREQLDELEKATGVKPFVISIIAGFEVRLERSLKRKRFPDEDENYLRERDRIEKERGLDGILERADVTIDTSTLTLEESREEFKRVLERLE